MSDLRELGGNGANIRGRLNTMCEQGVQDGRDIFTKASGDHLKSVFYLPDLKIKVERFDDHSPQALAQ
jgi:hypothetical protein